MIKYKKIIISEENKTEIETQNYLNNLIALSKSWVEEDICPSFGINEEKDYINQELYVAFDECRIVAYAKGFICKLENKTSYNEKGEKCFYLDEIYVNKSYRHQKIGKLLYKFMEKDLKNRVKVIKVNAASKEYKKLLHFYIDQLDMSFNYALVVKRID